MAPSDFLFHTQDNKDAGREGEPILNKLVDKMFSVTILACCRPKFVSTLCLKNANTSSPQAPTTNTKHLMQGGQVINTCCTKSALGFALQSSGILSDPLW